MLMKRSFATLMKVEDQEDGTIKVYGVASTGARDDAGEIITPEAMKAALPDYMKWGAIREMHQPTAAGTALDASVDADGATQLCAHVVDAAAIQKVKTKTYRGFSVGGKVLGRDPKDPTIITKIKLIEVSLVDRPCNPEAEISMWKAADIAGPEGDDMSDKTYQPTNEQVKAHAAELAKAAGKPDRVNDYLVKARDELVAKGAPAAEGDGGTQVVQAPSVEATGDLVVDGAVAAADKTAAAGGEAGAGTQDAPVPVDPVAAVQKALERAAKAGTDEADVNYADPGYQEDGKKRYPLNTVKRIKAAWAYINQEDNQKPYTAEQVEKIKDKIIAAWKAKIDPDGPPSAEKMLAPGDLGKVGAALRYMAERVRTDLGKGMYTVARLALLIEELTWLQSDLVYEAAGEGDNSDMPKELATNVAALLSTLSAMVAEESAEIVDAYNERGMDIDFDPASGGAVEVVEMACTLRDLAKADTVLMEKAGKRNSSKDQKHIQDAHDSAVKAGAKCDPTNCPEDEADKAAKAALAAENERLSKALTETVPALDDLTKRIDAQAERIRVLEAQPMPAKAAGSALAAVEKGADAAGAPEKTEPDAKDVEKWLATLSPEERTHLAMKATLARPVPIGG
jgi:hypothetical protein